MFAGARAPAGAGEGIPGSPPSPSNATCVASGDISSFVVVAAGKEAGLGPAGVTGEPAASASSILDVVGTARVVVSVAVTIFFAPALGFLRFLRLPKERDVPGVCPAFSELNERSVATTFGDRGESGVRARELGESLLTLLVPDAIAVMFSMFSVAFAAATSKVGVQDVCDCELGTMPLLVHSMDLSAGVIMPTSSPLVYVRVFCDVNGDGDTRGG